MRRVSLGVLASAMVLSVLSVSQPGQAAPATIEPTVDHSAHLSFQHVDLTRGRHTLVVRAKGSATARLVLDSVQVTDQPTGGDVFISTDSPGDYYRLGYRPLRKLSGDARHGVWRARVRLNRHLPADTYHLLLHWTVGGVDAWSAIGKTLVIDNAHPDTHAPVVVAQNRPLAGATFARSDHPKVSLHLHDRGTGLSLVWVCYYNVADPSHLECDEALKRSGTKNDGVWRTRLTRLHKLAAGDVVLRISTFDRVTQESDWVPADQLGEYPYASVIPGGLGHLTLTD